MYIEVIVPVTDSNYVIVCVSISFWKQTLWIKKKTDLLRNALGLSYMTKLLGLSCYVPLVILDRLSRTYILKFNYTNVLLWSITIAIPAICSYSWLSTLGLGMLTAIFMPSNIPILLLLPVFYHTSIQNIAMHIHVYPLYENL